MKTGAGMQNRESIPGNLDAGNPEAEKYLIHLDNIPDNLEGFTTSCDLDSIPDNLDPDSPESEKCSNNIPLCVAEDIGRCWASRYCCAH